MAWSDFVSNLMFNVTVHYDWKLHRRPTPALQIYLDTMFVYLARNQTSETRSLKIPLITDTCVSV